MPFVEIKALPGDRVMAKNYNKQTDEWEPGEVQVTETRWRPDGPPRNSYRVILDRKSKKGNYLFVTVGDDGIFPVNETTAKEAGSDEK